MFIPVIIKLIVSLLVIILVNRVAKNLPVSLISGSLAFALWIGLSFKEILMTAYQRVWNFNTGGLMLLVGLVIILSMLMKQTGVIEELVATIRGSFSARSSIAVLPAMIGLLPMPGGALFSAPLLDHFDDIPGIDPNVKTRINYWYRHVWEYAWPLYPGIIIACDVAGIALWQIFFLGIPLSISAIFIGYFFYLSKIDKNQVGDPLRRAPINIRPFIPILTVVISYILIQLFFPAIPEANQYLPMVIGLIISVTTLQVRKPLSLDGWWQLITAKNLYKMMLIILMVRIYGAFIDVSIDGIPIVRLMTQEMQQLGVPTLPLIMLIPFLAGITMGVSVGFAGSALPVVIALLGQDPSFGVLAGTLLFSYVCGFMGTMLSPLHVCMIVTCEYYKTGLSSSFRAVIMPAIVLIIVAFTYMQILILLFPH